MCLEVNKTGEVMSTKCIVTSLKNESDSLTIPVECILKNKDDISDENRRDNISS